MKKALLLHGWCGKSDNHWFPWLKRELEKKWYEVFIPDLPDSEYPVLDYQLNDISEIVHNFGIWDVIVGHSLGCQLALHAIHYHELHKIQAIFVGPSYPGMTEALEVDFIGEAYDYLVSYNNVPLNFQELDNSYVICLSEDDNFIDLEEAEWYYCMLEDVEYLEYEDKGHFNKKSSVFELPDILDYV
jgi:predicted alpha/beta hydrolase family esterase